ncbi:hypothetical protein HOLleu_42520 [Holothuria leucospilota]|uniref:Uncharacterized protein n=1 Tax=Holothuria leucospilota TaxID=206669 RepID=A0A9Q0YAT3_HOLLE|nr:hypothetical protein HOLleu_42520 [Holothuria leucospilota]
MTEGGPISNALQSIKDMIKDYGPMDDDSEGSESGDDNDCEDSNYVKKVLKPLLGSLLNYCRQIPVVSFNSGKYDINVMKGHLYRSLEKIRMMKVTVNLLSVKLSNAVTITYAYPLNG